MAVGMTPQAMGQMATTSAPREPFVWGSGGRRMTPEEIERERQIAASLMQIDASPVGHWSQGLARVAQNFVGGMREKRADEASAANVAESNSVLSALMSPGGEVPASGGNPSVAAALVNPYVGKGVRDLAEMQYRTANRAPPQPSEFERELEASGIARNTPQWAQAMKTRVANKLDPLMVIPTANGPFVTPRSQALLGGGDPASAAPGGVSPPSTLPPDFDAFDKEGGPTPSASGSFR